MPTASNTPTFVNIQGVPVDQTQIDPDSFFKYTRRQRGQMAAAITSWAGFGNSDIMELKQVGILGAIDIKFEGAVTVTPGTGSAATTYKWPYSLIKACKVSANGQTNLINVNGTLLKVRQFISQPGLTDRGVSQTVGGSTVTQGTLSLASESWGVGQGSTISSTVTAAAVVLSWRVPISWDLVKLFGALYLQTSATTVSLEIDWALQSDVFTLTGNATAALTGGWSAEGVVFSIPKVNGQPVIPDLSAFHGFVQTNTNGIGQTSNQVVLAGQGVGKQLMRVIGSIWTGSTGPGAPLAMDITNFGQLGWGYGLSETPEIWEDGDSMRQWCEELYGIDIGPYQGLFSIDFASHWAFRDSVDEGSATQLNLYLTILASLTNQRLEYAQEVMITGGLGLVNPALTAANEFGFSTGIDFSTPQSASEPAPTSIGASSTAPAKWYQHPGLVLFGLVGVTATALFHTSKPIVSAGGHVKAGAAEASAEGGV